MSRRNVLLLVGEIEVGHPISGNAMQVAMVDFETGNDEADSGAAKDRLLGEPNALRHIEDMS